MTKYRLAWPRDLIHSLVNEAETRGSAFVELGSPREAELFRFAVYNFRRKTDLGKGLGIAIDNKIVCLAKNQVTIKRLGSSAMTLLRGHLEGLDLGLDALAALDDG